jgi:hypothetical protein
MSMVPAAPASYPATLNIDYPDRKLNRLTSFFRIFTVIPIAIVLSSLTGLSAQWSQHYREAGGLYRWEYGASAGILFLAVLLMVLFRKKYPRWWFDWHLAFSRFNYRVCTYVLLLRDEYPSTDEEQAVHLNLVYPDVQTQLGRGMPLVKWFLAIPHYFVLCFLAIAAIAVWLVAWFAILFTGRYPRGMFDFTAGVLRWGLRVSAYAALLITDEYPPFSLE